MNLYRVTTTDSLSKLTLSNEQKLCPGQIIQGKILKLFPENKAEILLGGERLIASLEVGLQVGSKYHFQVQAAPDFLQLKVLGEKLQGRGEVDTAQLLNQLGLKQSKPNLTLLTTFIRLKIPFDKQQLTQAVSLLKEEKSKSAAIKILTDMIAQKLPIKNSTFQALSLKNNTTLSEQFQSVIQQMQRKSISETATMATEKSSSIPQNNAMKTVEDKLISNIRAFIDKPMIFKTAFVQEVLGRQLIHSKAIFQTLQGLGITNLHTDFTKWVSEWTAFSQKESVPATQLQAKQQPVVALPLQLDEEEMIQVLTNIKDQRPAFNEAIRTFLTQWDQQLNLQQLMKTNMTTADFNRMISAFQKEIRPFFQGAELPMAKQLTNTPESLGAFYSAIKALANGEGLSRLIQILQKAANDEVFMDLDPKQQFLQLQKQTVNTLGINYENQLLTDSDPLKQTETIKGMLLQLIADPNQTSQEANTKLLHLINGVQLQSVNETPTMIQASLQIPAKRLGLVKDLELEFEGKKNKNGEVNPDYCRILFYLELGNLKETIIDLNVQQRMVSITIFNNHEAIKAAAALFKNQLEINLESMNYKLSALHYKKIAGKENEREGLEISFSDPNQEGIDYRI